VLVVSAIVMFDFGIVPTVQLGRDEKKVEFGHHEK
jgi:hypothetical protein